MRGLLAPDQPWLHYLPSIVGGVGLVVWLAMRRGPWDRARLGPPRLLASVVTASFGWSFDQVVLLPAVVAIAMHLRGCARRRQAAIVVSFIGAQVGLLLVNHWQVGDQYTVWHGWVVSGLYWWALRPGARQDRRPAAGAAV
jgi:hypothetical protein